MHNSGMTASSLLRCGKGVNPVSCLFVFFHSKIMQLRMIHASGPYYDIPPINISDNFMNEWDFRISFFTRHEWNELSNKSYIAIYQYNWNGQTIKTLQFISDFVKNHRRTFLLRIFLLCFVQTVNRTYLECQFKLNRSEMIFLSNKILFYYFYF